jgi:hypothetical protein
MCIHFQIYNPKEGCGEKQPDLTQSRKERQEKATLPLVP